MIALGLGIGEELVARAEDKLKLAIFQTAFDPDSIRRQMRKVEEIARQERMSRLRDARVLQSVAQMEEPEDEPDAYPVDGILGKSKTAGIADAWKKR
jgi:hypothetical protein